jgi:hypothetical protein
MFCDWDIRLSHPKNVEKDKRLKQFAAACIVHEDRSCADIPSRHFKAKSRIPFQIEQLSGHGTGGVFHIHRRFRISKIPHPVLFTIVEHFLPRPNVRMSPRTHGRAGHDTEKEATDVADAFLA